MESVQNGKTSHITICEPHPWEDMRDTGRRARQGHAEARCSQIGGGDGGGIPAELCSAARWKVGTGITSLPKRNLTGQAGR